MRNTNITPADDSTCGRHSPTVHGSPVAPKTPPPPLRDITSVVEPPLYATDRQARTDSTSAPGGQQVAAARPFREMPALRNARTSVRRRLFIEHQDEATDDTIWETDNRTNAFLESMRVDRERARQMWNFDFETETPLPGVWQWERVPGENICDTNSDNLNNCNVNSNSFNTNSNNSNSCSLNSNSCDTNSNNLTTNSNDLNTNSNDLTTNSNDLTTNSNNLNTCGTNSNDSSTSGIKSNDSNTCDTNSNDLNSFQTGSNDLNTCDTTTTSKNMNICERVIGDSNPNNNSQVRLSGQNQSESSLDSSLERSETIQGRVEVSQNSCTQSSSNMFGESNLNDVGIGVLSEEEGNETTQALSGQSSARSN